MQETERKPTASSGTAAPAGQRRGNLGVAVALSLLLVVHAALLTVSAARNSVTVDEYAHLPAGLAYLKYGEWSIYHQSPPLLRMWAAWPALLGGAEVPPATKFRDDSPADRHWNYADEYAALNRDRYHSLLIAARLPMIALSAAGLLLVYGIARTLHGPGAGLLAATLYAACPNLAANGSIVGTDAGTAVVSLAAIWCWIRFCRQPTTGRCALAGAALSAALLCKFSALLLIPIVAIIAAWSAVADPRRTRSIVAGVTVVTVFALLAINLAYGYRGSFTAIGEYRFGSTLLRAVQSNLPAATPVPLPREFVRGFDEQKREADLGYPAYLLGEQYRGRRWLYYPVAVAVKTPAATLIIIAVAVATLLARPPARDDPQWMLVAAAATFAIGFVVLAPINIGVRYLLPIFPIAFVLAGAAWTGRRRKPAVALLAGIAMIESLPAAPRFIPFFNVIAGGPINGQSILNDSNVDWGQALIDLRRWMRDNQVDRVQLAYFGRIDPQIYGIAYTPATQSGGERFIAVSSYFRAGMAYRMPTPGGGRTGFVDLPIAPLLRRIQPVAVVGDVIWIYDRADVIEAMKSRDNVR